MSSGCLQVAVALWSFFEHHISHSQIRPFACTCALQDDMLIKSEGLDSLTVEELRAACKTRGLKAAYGEGAGTYMRKQMQVGGLWRGLPVCTDFQEIGNVQARRLHLAIMLCYLVWRVPFRRVKYLLVTSPPPNCATGDYAAAPPTTQLCAGCAGRVLIRRACCAAKTKLAGAVTSPWPAPAPCLLPMPLKCH
jgi:hypothetical protein